MEGSSEYLVVSSRAYYRTPTSLAGGSLIPWNLESFPWTWWGHIPTDLTRNLLTKTGMKAYEQAEES